MSIGPQPCSGINDSPISWASKNSTSSSSDAKDGNCGECGRTRIENTVADRGRVMAIAFARFGLPLSALTDVRMSLPSVAFERRLPQSGPQKPDLEFR